MGKSNRDAVGQVKTRRNASGQSYQKQPAGKRSIAACPLTLGPSTATSFIPKHGSWTVHSIHNNKELPLIYAKYITPSG